MPMEIYGDINKPIVNTFYSPVIELVCAVHILTDAGHHQFELKWAEEMLSSLTKEEFDSLGIIRQYPSGGMELLNFVLESGELIDINAFISFLKNIDIVDYYFFMLNENVDRTRIQKAFNDRKERYKIQEKIRWIVEDHELMEFFDRPSDIKDSTIRLFEAVIRAGFMNRLSINIPKMEQGIDYINSFVSKDTIDVVLEKISGRSKSLFTGYKEYHIIPSYFVSPRFINIYNSDKLFVVFDCRVTRDKKEALLDELSSIMKVINDRSRMEILRILVSKKSYGKAISELVGLSTPTVSHHLDILLQAGFVKEEKIRNIKYFYADKEKMKKVIEDINKYFFNAD